MEINELLAFNKKHLRRFKRNFNKIKFKMNITINIFYLT